MTDRPTRDGFGEGVVELGEKRQDKKRKGFIGKLGALVKRAIDCCIE